MEFEPDWQAVAAVMRAEQQERYRVAVEILAPVVTGPSHLVSRYAFAMARTETLLAEAARVQGSARALREATRLALGRRGRGREGEQFGRAEAA